MIEQKEKCYICQTPREQLTDTPWGCQISPGVWGIKCKPCAEKMLQDKIKAFQESELDTEYTDDIICPNCGHEHERDSEHEEFYVDGEHDFHCWHCSEEFLVNTSISYTYSTYKKEDKKN